MRTVRVIIILLVLGLLAVPLLLSLPHKSLNPPVSIQAVSATTNGMQFHRLRLSGGGSPILKSIELQETNMLTTNVWNEASIIVEGMDLSRVVEKGKTYRVIGLYHFSRGGVFGEKLCSWAKQVPVLNGFVPPAKRGLATSEWFVVKPEGSGTNMEH
jgi:hypothetical protein